MKASSHTINPTRQSNLLYNKKKSCHLLWMTIMLAACFTGYGGALQAQQPVTYKQELDGAAGQLAKDSSRTVIDSVLVNPGAFPPVDTQASYTISNMIVFHINESSLRMLPDSLKAELTIKVYFTNQNNVSDSTPEKKLHINYYKNGTYNNKAVYYFGGAKSVTVKVIDIRAAYPALAVILPLLKVENRMVVRRTFNMDCDNDAITTVSHNTATVSTKGELLVSWPGLNAAREYDLEWTFIDQSALDAGWYNSGGSADPEKLFRNNATRVTIQSNSYPIPLLYEGDGRLFYRVRAAQTTPDKERKVTAWSSAFTAQGGLGEYVFSGHERSLNWQASTSFAEDGKRKSVVQYFDGTLRGRQTVTKDNTTDTTLVAETFYDKQGRAVIEVLPAPTLSALIGYTPLFNQARSDGMTVENTPGVYDTIKTAADYCEFTTPPLDSVSGAAQYYSYNNPNKLNPIHKFIPQAKGYPFSEVKYTQDNTGRIASQGGVGPQFRLGSGHETRYYYGTPLQSELDALFGTEAGIASHYQKNMVRDANGQYSVSYVDMHGRTVATALAGAVPDSLQALPSYRDSLQIDTLLTPVNNVVKGNTITSVSTLLVTQAGVDSFFYRLNPESLQLSDKDAVEICYDCLYDLEITIADDCNNQNLPGDSLFVFRKSNMRVQPPVYDTTCAAAGTFDVNIGLNLEEGSYTVTKKLTLRSDAQAYYRDSLYAPHHTVQTKEDIIAEQLSRIREQRGSDCVQEGEPWYVYQQYRDQMLLDMTPPFGQYAGYPGNKSRLSIFNSNGIQPLYSTVSYPHNSDEPNPAMLSPEQLLYNFKPDWAEALLPLHPEYCMLQGYEQYKPAYHWDADFETTDTYQQALTKGYLNPTNLASSPASAFGNGNDSMFYGGANSAVKTRLSDSLVNYKTIDGKTYSLWAVASIMGHCDPTDEACVNSFYNTPGNAFNPGVMGCEGELDMAWRFFRNEYLRLKHKRIDNMVRSICQPVISDSASPVFLSEADAIAKAGDLLNGDLAAAQQAAADSLGNMAERACLAYAESWWRQLETCQYSTEDSAIIIPRLIEVCQQGSDSTHPFGASSVRPTSNYEYRSFDDVISRYNTSTGRPNDAACNAYLIDAPAPYNRPVLTAEQPLYTKPDDCTCEKITALHDRYSASTGYGSFSDYVQKTLHTNISQGVLDSLLALCSGNIACRYIAQPITLPPALQCTTGYDVCADCNTVSSIYNTFKAAFPGIIPTYEEITEQQQGNNRLFANYMNNKLGFSKPAQEYLAFMDSCGTVVATPCDSLEKMVTEYVWDTATNCQTTFANYYNQQKGTSYTFEQIDSVYFNTCGKHLDVCGGTAADKGSLQALINAFNKAQNPYRGRIILQSNRLNPPFYVPADERMISDGHLHWPKAIRDSTGRGWVYYQQLAPSGGAPMCVENGYSFEFRFKSLKKLSNADDVYYVQGGNIHFVLYRRSTGSSTGFFLKSISERGTSPGTLVFSGMALMDSDPDIIFKEWCTIKATITATHFQIYYNDNLIKEVERPAGASWINTTKFTHCFYDYQAMVDWFKTYDGNGKLVYFEDFNDPYNRAAYAPDFICTTPTPSCEQGFTTYFNQQKATSYTFSQIDSIYTAAGLTLDVCGLDTATIRCDQLENYVQEYKDRLGRPASGYVDLDMRTFAGNKTPDEGPKGVFDVKGKLLGNTVDSTPTAVKQSYVEIWNSSADNRQVGTLSLLETGRFRLALNPGKQAPKEGIVGQRYYQVDVITDVLDGLITGTGTYIDFGDSTGTKVNDRDSTSVTVTKSHVGSGEVETAYPDSKIVYYYYTKHFYSYSASRTVTVYHSDFKGLTGFDCSVPANCGLFSNVKNLRGYFPQDLTRVTFHTTQDSTINSFANIKNFDGITSIQYFDLQGHAGNTGFRNNRFSSFEKNHEIKHIIIDNDGSVSRSEIRPINEYFPDLPDNFPELASIRIRPYDTLFAGKLDFTLPNLRELHIQNAYISSSFVLTTQKIDEIINQVAAGAQHNNGALTILPYGTTARSTASDNAVALLTSKGWTLTGAGMNNVDTPASFKTPFVSDTLPWFTPFTDFINAKFNTSLTAAQADSIYLARCGHKPNWYDTTNGSFPAGLLLCGKNEPVSPALSYEQVYDPPCSDSSTLAFNSGTEIYTMYKDSLNNIFDSLYTAQCLGAAALEQFGVKRHVSEYHYTLYYYDQAGNLVKTIPPEGVQPVRRQGWLDTVALKRAAGERWVNGHTMPTVYRYNSLNQVVSQRTPDAGKSTNWYDRLGRPAVSRNAQQTIDGKYSYTMYDALGRITEVGQKPQATPMTSTISRDPEALANWLFYNNNGANGAEMVTQTVYDHPGIDATACIAELRFTQKPYTLRNRVSYTRYYEKPAYYNGGDGRYYISGQSYTTGVDYSYDIHGKVDTMRNLYGSMQYGPMAHHGYNACKTIAYTYDLISGKVNEVHYNPGQNDEFYHRYEYDAENRLTDVYTTDNKLFIGQQGLEEHDAYYTYYRHGPLARMVIGQQRVQGIDYAYTLQGWLKGINGSNGYIAYDMGLDAWAAARDAYGYTLHYFGDDYNPINYSTRPFAEYRYNMLSLYPGDYRELYNGNISATSNSIPSRYLNQLYNYKYDQLNRLVGMDMYRGLGADNKWTTLAKSDLYKERYKYDANGNITHVLRNGHLTANPLMDSLTYMYTPGTNRLDHIRDRNAGSTAHNSNYNVNVDIKDQVAGNYTYDAIGNVKSAKWMGDDTIRWNIYGKVTEVEKRSLAGVTSRFMHYYYDPSGNKVGETVRHGTGGSAYYNHRWYVRDAQGNTLATYEVNNAVNAAAGTLKLREHYLYGSSRLGIINRDQDVDENKLTATDETNLGDTYLLNFTRGNKLFELTNHLGNVMVTVTDKKLGVPVAGNPTVIEYWNPELITSADHYPFGMIMQGRNAYASTKYRYGYNGKEMENEVQAAGNLLDYGNRLYDPLAGRFWSVDPLTSKYPFLTPYQFASNSPISGVDLDGLEYLGSNEARIEVVRGIVKLKIANMHNVTRNYLEALQSDTKNWSGTIGLDTRIGSITMGSAQQQFTNPATPNELNEDPTHNPEKIDIQNPFTKRGTVDQRYKQRSVESSSPVAIRRLGGISAALDVVIIGSQITSAKLGQHDFELVNQHSLLLQQATDDVNFALKNSKLIPRELQTEEGLSEITNVVLSGVSSLNNKKAVEVGMEIYNTFSKRRQMYDGFTEITGPSGQVIMKTPKLNPIYDPNYAKEAAER